jgi:hypothetical protein
VQRVDLAIGQHPRQRLAGTDRPQMEALRQIELQLLVAPRLLLAPGVIGDAGGIDAVLVGQDAANPHRRGHLVFRHADALAHQVLRALDPAFRRDEDATVAEQARREHRDRHERRIGAAERHAIG